MRETGRLGPASINQTQIFMETTPRKSGLDLVKEVRQDLNASIQILEDIETSECTNEAYVEVHKALIIMKGIIEKLKP